MDKSFRACDRHGAEMEFELVEPTLVHENEGERQYRIAYNQAIKEGIFPREKLREIMKQYEMWTDADEKELKRVIGRLALLSIELEKVQAAGNTDECLRIAKDMSESRHRLMELFFIQQSVYMNSAEGVAEAIKHDAIMSSCTILKHTRQKYWKNYSEYVSERDMNEKSTVYLKLVELYSKMLEETRVNVMKEYPERKYVKTVEERTVEREVKEEIEKRKNAAIQASVSETNDSTKSVSE